MRGARPTMVAACVAALAAVVGTACGGNDDEPGALSKSEFAKQANALCAKAGANRNAQLQPLPPNPSGAADAQKFKSSASTDRELIRRVDA
ncbi:MAG TPA: hypothetical protein VKB11_02185, partial [Acidimicrobiia bacterium]|nr:hypothetical protein [Acidimicrobiia bacterium]